jgi:FtsH-binding integral membrane protein
MSNTSNFRQAIRDAKSQALIGPNVIANALPYVGGGLVLTALGTYGGLGVLRSNPQLFMTTFWVALIAEIALFFVASGIARQGKNGVALPLLATYSLLSGYTLSGLIFLALRTPGVGLQGIGFAALGCGVTFIAGRQIGSNLSDEDGMALAKTVQLGMIALIVVLVAQLLFSFFGGGFPSWLEIGISALVSFYLPGQLL